MADIQSRIYQKCFILGHLRTYKKGEVIIRPDDPPRGVFYIEQGFIRVYSLNPDGSERVHIIYQQGQIFPVIWALRGIHKNLFYEALEKTAIRLVEKNIFLRRMKEDESLMYEVMLLLTDTFETFVDRVNNLEITNSYSRIIARLLYLAKRFGEQEDGRVIIQVPLTHKDIALSIAMTRETASREIEILTAKGLIRLRKHKFEILDKSRLEEELTHHYERKTL